MTHQLVSASIVGLRISHLATNVREARPYRRLCGAVLAFLCLGFTPNAQAQHEAILNRLRFKDAQLNNVAVSYDKWKAAHNYFKPRNQTGNLDSRGSSRLQSDEDALEASQSVPTYLRHDVLAIRWPSVTFTVNIDRGASEELVVGAGRRFGNTEGMRREILHLNKKQVGGRVLTIQPASKGPVSVTQESAMKVEFAMGLGFGKRIVKIDSVSHSDRGMELEGSIKLWSRDVTQFRALVDENLIVREAHIEGAIPGSKRRNTFRVQTDGTFEKDGCLVAKNGVLCQSKQQIGDDGTYGKVMIYDDFRLQVQEIQLDLSDEEYAKLTSYTITPGTTVIDRIAGFRYTADKDGKQANAIGASDLTELLSQDIEPAPAQTAKIQVDTQIPVTPVIKQAIEDSDETEHPWVGLLIIGLGVVSLTFLFVWVLRKKAKARLSPID
jgi:hypothetical protein